MHNQWEIEQFPIDCTVGDCNKIFAPTASSRDLCIAFGPSVLVPLWPVAFVPLPGHLAPVWDAVWPITISPALEPTQDEGVAKNSVRDLKIASLPISLLACSLSVSLPLPLLPPPSRHRHSIGTPGPLFLTSFDPHSHTRPQFALAVAPGEAQCGCLGPIWNNRRLGSRMNKYLGY